VDDEDYVSPKGTSKHDIWLKLCNLISKHPEDLQGIDSENIIRHAIKLYTDEVVFFIILYKK